MQRLISIADRRHGRFRRQPQIPTQHGRAYPVIDAGLASVTPTRLQGFAPHARQNELPAASTIISGADFTGTRPTNRWLVPHFEKDAVRQLAARPRVSRSLSGDRRRQLCAVVRETLGDYVLREMTQPGPVASTAHKTPTLTARSEGKFFVRTETEIESSAGPGRREDLRCYDVAAGGNWEEHTILNRPKTDAQAASEVLGRTSTRPNWHRCSPRCRQETVRTCVRNVSLQSATTKGARQLERHDDLGICQLRQGAWRRTATHRRPATRPIFCSRRYGPPTAGCCTRTKTAKPASTATSTDYACLIDGLVEAYQATFEPKYLDQALTLAETMIKLFHDETDKGFFYTSSDHEMLIARNKEAHDGSTPSGNSMAAWALLRLGRICGRSDLEEIATSTLEFLSSVLAQSPTAAAQALLALEFLLGPTREIAIARRHKSRAKPTDVLKAVHQTVPAEQAGRAQNGRHDRQKGCPVSLKPLLLGKVARGGQANDLRMRSRDMRPTGRWRAGDRKGGCRGNCRERLSKLSITRAI